ncbi:hypothetical protein IPU80_004496 [Escherichia coli]|nr:hypothetical protein [Escherichia coli]
MNVKLKRHEIKNRLIGFGVANLIVFLIVCPLGVYWGVQSFFHSSVFNPLKEIYMIIANALYKNNTGHDLASSFDVPQDISFWEKMCLWFGVIIVIYVTMFLIHTMIRCCFDFFYQKTLIKYLGEKGFRRFESLSQYEDTKISVVEEASRKHYEAWVSYYKSSLTYDEWKEKIIKPLSKK